MSGIADYVVKAEFSVGVVREGEDAVVRLAAGRVIGRAKRREDGSMVVRSEDGSLLVVGGDELATDDEKLVELLLKQLTFDDGELKIERSG